MNLTYERMLQLLVVAHAESDFIARSFTIREPILTIRFSDYVKSQIHLNVISSYYPLAGDRSIFEYNKALEFLQGNAKFLPETENVLFYFYQDLAMFFLQNREEIKISALLDADICIAESQVMFSCVKKNFIRVLRNVVLGNKNLLTALDDNALQILGIADRKASEDAEDLVSLLDQFEYAEVFDKIEVTCDSINVICQRIDNYVYAAIYQRFSHNESGVRKVVIL